MKKVITLAVCGVLLLSSCGSTPGSGAWNGATFGSVIGSAIGGIMGGPRGSDVGTLVGMAVGGSVGAASGAAAQQQRIQQDRAEVRAHYRAMREARQTRQSQSSQVTQSEDNSGYTESGTYDDRLYDFNSDSNGGSSVSTITSVTPTTLQIINARFVDENHDGYLAPNEQGKVVFEIKNTGTEPAYDVLPMVAETTGNKHLQVSDNVHVECVQAGSTIRYAAMVLCDNRIKTGEVCFSVNVRYNGKDVADTQYFRIPVRR